MFRVGVGGLRLWVFSFGHFTMNCVHYPSSRKDYSSNTHCLEPMMPAQSNLYLISHYVLCPWNEVIVVIRRRLIKRGDSKARLLLYNTHFLLISFRLPVNSTRSMADAVAPLLNRPRRVEAIRQALIWRKFFEVLWIKAVCANHWELYFSVYVHWRLQPTVFRTYRIRACLNCNIHSLWQMKAWSEDRINFTLGPRRRLLLSLRHL